MKIFAYISIYSCFVLYAQGDSLNLENIFLKNKFRTSVKPALKFIKGGSQYLSLVDSQLVFCDTRTGQKVDSIKLPVKTDLVEDFEYHEIKNCLLLKFEIEPIYRRSYKCKVQIYDLTRATMIYPEKGDKIINPEWSKNGNKLAYTKLNNLYYYDFDNSRSYQITFDGKKNEIINGQTDWVYEEEFEFTKAYWWNEEGNKLAYLKFDESKVKSYQLQYWKSKDYPQIYEYKYPRVGEENSSVSLWVYDLTIKRQDSLFAAKDQYLPRVGWANKDVVFFYTMNRLQNQLEIMVGLKGIVSPIYKEKSDTYIELDPELFSDEKAIYFTSDKSGYNHIYKLEYVNRKCTALTDGSWDVLEISGLSNQNIYYTRTNVNSHTHTLAAKSLLNHKEYQYNLTGTASVLSVSSHFLVVSASTLQVPTTYHLLDDKLTGIRVLEDQLALKEKLKSLPLISAEFMNVKAQGYDIAALMLKSTNMDAQKKYPVLIYQYSGPGYQVVVDEWKGATFLWYNYLVQKGFVVLLVDPRGTGAKGAAFKRSTYLNLGLQESEDMVVVSKHLSKQPYVDSTRINIFGWSFGGYVAALCATKWSPYFNKSVSVAPVTDWRYYDNIYTERYMQTPTTNAKGYDTTSVLKYCKNFSSKFLLIHGTADDNVHIQHSHQLQKCLMEQNKQFDFFVFADKNHSIAGANTRYYLYKKITDFLLKD